MTAVGERPAGRAGMATIRHILVATDFGPASERALDAALAMAERLGARLTILHVYEAPPFPYAGVTPAPLPPLSMERLCRRTRRARRDGGVRGRAYPGDRGLAARGVAVARDRARDRDARRRSGGDRHAREARPLADGPRERRRARGEVLARAGPHGARRVVRRSSRGRAKAGRRARAARPYLPGRRRRLARRARGRASVADALGATLDLC